MTKMGILLRIVFLLAHGVILGLAVDCQQVRIDGPSGGQPSLYLWETGLQIQFGGWSDEEIKSCIGEADTYDIWLLSEDPNCPVAWILFGTLGAVGHYRRVL